VPRPSNTTFSHSNRFSPLQEPDPIANEGGSTCLDVNDNHSNEVSKPNQNIAIPTPPSPAPSLPANATIIPVGIVCTTFLIPRAWTSRHKHLDKTLCVDSSSTHDMFKEKECFQEYHPLEGTDILAADNTPVPGR